jgi:hypothetical protein
MEALKTLLVLRMDDENDDNEEAPSSPRRVNGSSSVRPLVGRLLHYDALRGAFLSLELPKARNNECLVCPSSAAVAAARIRSMEDSGAWVAAAGLRGRL